MNTTFFRFLAAGVANTAAGASVMFSLYHIAGFSYYTSSFAGNTFGLIISFWLNRTFTFRCHAPLLPSAFRFFVVGLFSYALAYFFGEKAASVLFVDSAGSWALLFGLFLYTLINYAAQRFVVFRTV